MAQPSGNFFEQATFWVTDKPGGGGGAPPGGGECFAMNTEEMTTELARLERLYDRIEAQKKKAAPMVNIVSPGYDPASVRNTEACNRSGRYYLGHIDRESQYLGTIIEKMRVALGVTEENDERAAEDIVKQSGGYI